MDQVSRPLLIVLASTIVLAALWLVALRPKDPEIANTPAAPVTAIAKVNKAAAATEAKTAKVQAATGETPAPPAPTAVTPAGSAPAGAAAPAATPVVSAATASKRDAAVVRDIRANKVVVMLFWNAKGADDVATRGVVRAINRRGGKVAVHVIPISRVAQYESITQGITINQSPTTLVIDRKGQARPIVGLTERGELTQAISDALAGRR